MSELTDERLYNIRAFAGDFMSSGRVRRSTVIELCDEVRALRERVAVLVDAIDDAPHAQGCVRGVAAYSGRIDRFGTFPACNCWKADANEQEDDDE